MHLVFCIANIYVAVLNVEAIVRWERILKQSQGSDWWLDLSICSNGRIHFGSVKKYDQMERDVQAKCHLRVAPWCYKWTDGIELDLRAGGVRYRAPFSANYKRTEWEWKALKRLGNQC